ncbi:MAG: phosphoribosylaminoimidazolesuccinocarboxamide synthase [Candidatus Bilamarchaeaceae archaeon]
MEIITKTELPLPLIGKGKVRETYKLNDKLLMVATDRLSAFDVVFNEGIPYKGIVLNMLSKFWFEKTKHIIRNHFITLEIPKELPAYLKGRSMVVEPAKPLKVECVVRGYITGSGWKEYQKSGSVCGIKLPVGLKNGDKLNEPIFTPSTKAAEGHDQNISFEEATKIVGKEIAEKIKETSLKLYKFGHDYAFSRGLVLADTKFEFGVLGEEVILIDEAMTPDSSRYWLKEEYEKGNLVSMDKQFVRDFLERSGWDKNPPPPPLPKDVIENTSILYRKAYEMLTGNDVLKDIKKI